ncbi:hypothetical protein BDZ91DRAFT_744334 [Kalaharituber pfeilii]|nr:hypothetical protein BDZ91DRAFT_744334 [Kalaharituber pfeilii]
MGGRRLAKPRSPLRRWPGTEALVSGWVLTRSGNFLQTFLCTNYRECESRTRGGDDGREQTEVEGCWGGEAPMGGSTSRN